MDEAPAITLSIRVSARTVFAGAPVLMTVEALETPSLQPAAGVDVLMAASWGVVTPPSAGGGAGRSVRLRTDARGLARVVHRTPAGHAMTPTQADALLTQLTALGRPDRPGWDASPQIERFARLYRLDTHGALREAVDQVAAELDGVAPGRSGLDVSLEARAMTDDGAVLTRIAPIRIVAWTTALARALERVIEAEGSAAGAIKGLELDGFKAEQLAGLAMSRLDRVAMHERGALGKRAAESHVQRSIREFIDVEVSAKPVEERLVLRAGLGPAGAMGSITGLSMLSATVKTTAVAKSPGIGRDLNDALQGFRTDLRAAVATSFAEARRQLDEHRGLAVSEFATLVATRLDAASRDAQSRFEAAGIAAVDAMRTELTRQASSLTAEARAGFERQIAEATLSLRQGVEREITTLSTRVRDTVQTTIADFTREIGGRVERLERTAVTTDRLNDVLTPINRDLVSLNQRQTNLEQRTGRDFTDVRTQLDAKADAQRLDALERETQAGLSRKLDTAAFTPFERNVNAQLQQQRTQINTINTRVSRGPNP